MEAVEQAPLRECVLLDEDLAFGADVGMRLQSGDHPGTAGSSGEEDQEPRACASISTIGTFAHHSAHASDARGSERCVASDSSAARSDSESSFGAAIEITA